jgi:hypothetical protein
MRLRLHAALLALWLVACGALSARHEARTAHAIDAAGRVVHAQSLGHHQDGSHVHDVSTADHGECAIASAFHQAASSRVRVPAIAAARPIAIAAQSAPTNPAPATARYRLAPKTSPPDRAG